MTDRGPEAVGLGVWNAPPSKLRRRLGIRIARRYALVRCGCGNHLIVGRGQQTRMCPRCGRRFWLHNRHVVLQSDDIELLRGLRWGRGNYYRPFGFVPADRFFAHRYRV